MAIKTWTTNYPTSLDTISNQPVLVNLEDRSDVTHPNSLSQAVRALEIKVGSDALEAGSLRARVAQNEADIATNTAGILTNTNAITALTSVQDGVTAYAGGGQADATLITSAFVRIATSDTHLDSVLLYIPVAGQEVEIRNDGAKDVAVYPSVGGQIDSLGTNAYYALASGSVQKFVAVSDSQWYTKNKAQRYVDLGDATVTALTQAGMTMDNSYYDLNLSSYLPPSARGKAARFRVLVGDATDGAFIRIRTNGMTTELECLNAPHAGTNAAIYANALGDILTDSSGIIEYKASEALTTAAIYLCGYWVEG